MLVAIVNNAEDLHRAAVEGWYRIPQRRAPRRIGADYLALYQTGAFRAPDGGANEAQSVTYFAPTRRYRLTTRRELMPDEQDHPRADETYYCIEIGPLQRLEHPVRATTFRRVTFIHTTLACLLSAADVRDLFRHDDPFEQLWDALREHNLRPLKNRLAGDHPIDIALRARGGYLGINCVEELCTQEGRLPPLPERWEVIDLPAAQIVHDLDGCLRQIGAALLNLGGSMLGTDAQLQIDPIIRPRQES